MTSGGVFFLVRQTISLRFLHQNRMIVSDSFFRRARPFRDWPRASERSPHAPFGSRSISSGSDRICRFIHVRKLTVRDMSFSAWFGKKHGDRVGRDPPPGAIQKKYKSEVMVINYSG